MKDKIQHSPIPWRTEYSDIDGMDSFIVDVEKDLIADTFASTFQAVGVPDRDVSEANAAFIVEAANNYETLVDILEEFCGDVQAAGMAERKDWPDLFVTYERAREALNEIKNL